MLPKKLDELADALEGMSQQELNRFARRCICQSLYASGPTIGFDAHAALDIVYAEYTRRGVEKQYDIAFDSVTKHPDVCNAA
jgi:hypothetical protein